jgi:hypothetical protein
MEITHLLIYASTHLRIHEIAPLHLSRTLYKSPLFMQNKPNFRESKMNVSAVKTNGYENNQLSGRRENKPNQTQTNPISNVTLLKWVITRR